MTSLDQASRKQKSAPTQNLWQGFFNSLLDHSRDKHINKKAMKLFDPPKTPSPSVGSKAPHAPSSSFSGEAEINSRRSMWLPWLIPFFERLNGAHPLVVSYIEHMGDFNIVRLKPQSATITRQVLDRILVRFADRTRRLNSAQMEILATWLDFSDQITLEEQTSAGGLVFMHTTPLYIGTQDWIFHFESFPTLFMPFLKHGSCRGCDLKRQAYFHQYREWLMSPQCKIIFSHMQDSLTIAGTVFDNPEISAKMHHVPLGIETRPSETCLKTFEREGALRILFTNSLHQDPYSFYLRGGHHLLRAFSDLRRRNRNIFLTIVSSVPADFSSRFKEEDLDGVTWIKHRVPDADLATLLDNAHIFALPAAGLHSFSFLRALAHGCVPLVSDAPGYDEWLRGMEESVFVLRGVAELIYRHEPAGWISDDYTDFVADNNFFSGQIFDVLNNIGSLLELRKLASDNLKYCALNHSKDRSRRALDAMFAKSKLR